MPFSSQSLYSKKNSFFHENKDLWSQRIVVAAELNIKLEEPKQQKRIEALFLLLKKYLYKSDVKSFLYQKVIEYSNKLTDVYKTQIADLEEIKNIKTLQKSTFLKIN